MKMTEITSPKIEAYFFQVMDSLELQEFTGKLAVAVSGGSDSLALTLLADKWATARQIKLIALTVDHGIRPGSYAEAQQVRKWLEKYNIEHHILRVEKSLLGRGNLQAKAREARYQLLIDYCSANSVGSLLAGHHLEDQAETFLMGLGRGSGLDGLAAMPLLKMIGTVRLIRPLLGLFKSEINGYLTALNQEWCEDPTNQNQDFLRVRLRQASGINDRLLVKRIAEASFHLGRVKNSLDRSVDKAMEDCVKYDGHSSAVIQVHKFRQLPEEEGLRVLHAVLQDIGSRKHKIRFSSIIRLYGKIVNEEGGCLTLSGCKLVWPGINSGEGNLLVMSEILKNAPVEIIKPGESKIWNDKFIFEYEKNGLDTGVQELQINYLGVAGYLQIKNELLNGKNESGLPTEIYFTYPALWALDKVVAVPHIKYYNVKGLENLIKCSSLYSQGQLAHRYRYFDYFKLRQFK